ncbi:MAG: hypothetical protein ACOCZK_06945, partial [Planctomycetota bacterium]
MRTTGLPNMLEAAFETADARAPAGERQLSLTELPHVHARKAIDAMLAGDGFGRRALALVQTGHLADLPDLPAGLSARAFAAACELPRDPIPGEVPGIPGALPADRDALATQILPLVTTNPGRIGFQAAITAALLALWPHATREERLRLRRAWLAGVLCATPTNPHSVLTREQLCAWQRDMQTQFHTEAPCPSVMVELLEDRTARGAYTTLASYLGPCTDVPSLSWIMGSCARQALVRRHDRHAQLFETFSGSLACEAMASLAPCEHMITLLSQLTHQIWWHYNQGGLDRIATGRHEHPIDLPAAIAAGDYAGAQAAARRAVRNRSDFWQHLYHALDRLLASNAALWPRALDAILVTAMRNGPSR